MYYIVRDLAMHTPVVKKRDVTSAGSSGQAFGQAGTSDSSYSERHLIYVRCFQIQERRPCVSFKYDMNPGSQKHTQHPSTHTHTQHTNTHTHDAPEQAHTHTRHTYTARPYHTEHSLN